MISIDPNNETMATLEAKGIKNTKKEKLVEKINFPKNLEESTKNEIEQEVVKLPSLVSANQVP